MPGNNVHSFFLENTMQTHWIHRLRERRQQQGLSQSALAQRAGVSPRLISDLEAGRQQTTSPQKLQALATALGVTRRYLCTGNDRTD